MCFQNLPISEIHMDTTGQARIEAANGAHDIDSLELVRAIFLKYRRVLYRILIWPWSSEAIAGICIPRSWRIWVIVGDLVIANHDVMRQDSAHGFVEAATDTFFRNFEVVPGPSATCMQLPSAPARQSTVLLRRRRPGSRCAPSRSIALLRLESFCIQTPLQAAMWFWAK